MAQAANRVRCLPRQLSFKAAMQQMRAFEEQLRHGAQTHLKRLCEVLISAVGQVKLPHRPGRVEPRAVKRRSKNHAHLAQPRSALKAQLLVLRELKMNAVFA